VQVGAVSVCALGLYILYKPSCIVFIINNREKFILINICFACLLY
jgi:hypothetical protein